VRDVGIFVWVALLLVGVIGSMVSSVRRRLQAPGRPAGQRPAVRPPAFQARPPASPGMAAPAPAASPRSRGAPAAPAREPEAHEPPPRAERRKLFTGKGALARAVIAAEVLGKPRAFGDEYPRG
jgi:hypothetical protein